MCLLFSSKCVYYFPQNVFTIFQLLDCFSIPTVLILSWFVLRARYRLSHIGGLGLALMSVVALVWADVDDGRGGVSAGGQLKRVINRNQNFGDIETNEISALSKSMPISYKIAKV
jgi:hypothetical protein